MSKVSHKIKQSGFILMEGLVTFMVLSVGMIAVAKFQGDNLTSNAETKTQTEAVNLAHEKLEELRNFVDDTAFNNMVANSDVAEARNGSNTTFSRTWTVTPNANPSYDTITVTVRWQNARGEAKSAQITSIVADSKPVQSAQLLLIPGYLDGSGPDEPAPTEDTPPPDETAPPPDPSTTPTDATTPPPDPSTADPLATSTTTTTTVATTTTTTTVASTTTTTLGSYYLTISGSFVIYGNTTPSNSVTASGTYAASCYATEATYQCDLGPIPSNDSWSGSVSVSTDKTYCSVNPLNPTQYMSISTDQSQDYNIGQNEEKCP